MEVSYRLPNCCKVIQFLYDSILLCSLLNIIASVITQSYIKKNIYRPLHYEGIRYTHWFCYLLTSFILVDYV